MKKLYTFLISIILVFTMVFCTSCNETEDRESQLLCWSTALLLKDYNSALKSDASNPAALYTKYIIEKFNERYPNITVVLQDKGWGEELNMAITQQYNVTQPDIVGSETYAQTLISKDYYAEVETSKLTDYIPATYQIFSRDSKTYVTPICTNSYCFMYNEKLLLESGCPTYFDGLGEEVLLVPETWAEVLYCCQKVNTYLATKYDMSKQLNKAKYAAYMLDNVKGCAQSFRVDLYTHLAGGSMYTDGYLNNIVMDGQLNFNTEKNIEGLSLMRELYKYCPYGSYSVEDESTLKNFLLRGDVAMTVEHPDMLASTSSNGVELKTAAIPVFVDGGDNLTPYQYSENNRQLGQAGVTARPTANILLGNVGYGITKTCDKKEVAEYFVEVSTSQEAQLYLYQLTGRLPTTKTALQAVKTSENATIKKYVKGMKYSIDELVNSYSNPSLVNIYGGTVCFGANITSTFGSFDNSMTEILTGTSSMSSILTTMQSNVARWLSN